MKKLRHHKYYRLPWTLSDNATTLLETRIGNAISTLELELQGQVQGHKSLEQMKSEILIYKQLRNFDSLSIGGTDLLPRSDLIEVVRFTANNGLKPILHTNGSILSEDLLKELKDSGLTGIMLHLDNLQNISGQKYSSELDLNNLRLNYANMIHKVGGLSCGFSITVDSDSLVYLSEMVRWAEEHIEKVNVMVFIAAKVTETDECLTSYDLYHSIRKDFIDYESSAYLNGTADPSSTKWLVTNRIGDGKDIFGYLGANFAKIVQTFHHWKWGKYLAFPKHWFNKLGRSIMLLAPLDQGVKRSFMKYVKSLIRNPLRLFKTVYFQTILFIEPNDYLADGSLNICDGCPDVTLWNGQLVCSCTIGESLSVPSLGQRKATVNGKDKELSLC